VRTNVYPKLLAWNLNTAILKECNELLSTLSFFTKKDNCAGLQIADFVPDSFIRELNGSKNFYNVKAIFLERLFGIEQNQQTTLGLKAL